MKSCPLLDHDGVIALPERESHLQLLDSLDRIAGNLLTRSFLTAREHLFSPERRGLEGSIYARSGPPARISETPAAAKAYNYTPAPHTSEAAHAREPPGRPNTRGSHATSRVYWLRAQGASYASYLRSRDRMKRQLIRSKLSKSSGAPAQTAVTVGALSGTEVPVTVLAGRSTASTVMMIGP
jgi:hypothetical protein